MAPSGALCRRQQVATGPSNVLEAQLLSRRRASLRAAVGARAQAASWRLRSLACSPTRSMAGVGRPICTQAQSGPLANRVASGARKPLARSRHLWPLRAQEVCGASLGAFLALRARPLRKRDNGLGRSNWGKWQRPVDGVGGASVGGPGELFCALERGAVVVRRRLQGAVDAAQQPRARASGGRRSRVGLGLDRAGLATKWRNKTLAYSFASARLVQRAAHNIRLALVAAGNAALLFGSKSERQAGSAAA